MRHGGGLLGDRGHRGSRRGGSGRLRTGRLCRTARVGLDGVRSIAGTANPLLLRLLLLQLSGVHGGGQCKGRQEDLVQLDGTIAQRPLTIHNGAFRGGRCCCCCAGSAGRSGGR